MHIYEENSIKLLMIILNVMSRVNPEDVEKKIV